MKHDMEEFMKDIILSFCENLAELGLPQSEEDPDMWFRYLSDEEQKNVATKLIAIMKRNDMMAKEDTAENVTKMVDMELDLSDEVIEFVKKYGREKIVNDDQALINYGVNRILKEVISTDGSCLKEEKEITYNEAKEMIDDAIKGLSDFENGVLVRHGDGSVFKFRHACYETFGQWVGIWSEHNGNHIYHIEDLDEIKVI